MTPGWQSAPRAAEALLAQHEAGAPITPLTGGALEPPDLDAAYAVQEALIGLYESRRGERIAGWKIALTTPVMQAFVGIDHPCAGPVFASRVHPSPARVARSDYVNLAVEAEIAVRLEADVPPGESPWDRARIGERVLALMPAIELVDDRRWDYDRADVRDLAADNAFNFGCVLGSECTDWRSLGLESLRGELWIDDERAGEGSAADVLGHPLEALAWLANHLHGRGRMLRAGELVLTGSVVATRWPEAGSIVRTRIQGLGEAVLEVA